jgi:hypothetical protein
MYNKMKKCFQCKEELELAKNTIHLAKEQWNMIQKYMVEILKQAGRNPKAVKLALPPTHLQPAFFVNRYFETLDKEKAYRLALNDCGDNEDCKMHCYIDMRAITTSQEQVPQLFQQIQCKKVSPYK